MQHSRPFPRNISCFLVSASTKKNDEVIRFLGILKEMSPRTKYIFAQERKVMFFAK